MYEIRNKLTTIHENERLEFKRLASIVIYGELLRYVNIKKENQSKSA